MQTVLRTSPGAAGRPAPEEETVSVLGRTNGGDQDRERRRVETGIIATLASRAGKLYWPVSGDNIPKLF